MSEWWKATISALAGVLVGLLAEPIRQRLTRYLDARRVREILWRDLSLIYVQFCVPNESGKWGGDVKELQSIIRYVPPDKFEYCYNTKREACYRLKGWMFVEVFYWDYTKIRQDILNNTISAEKSIREIRRAFVTARYSGPDGSLLAQVEEHFERRGIPRLAAEQYTVK